MALARSWTALRPQGDVVSLMPLLLETGTGLALVDVDIEGGHLDGLAAMQPRRGGRGRAPGRAGPWPSGSCRKFYRRNRPRRRTGRAERRFGEGGCVIPLLPRFARRSGPPLWSSTSHFKGKWDASAPGLAGDTRTMKTDKKGAVRLQTHLLLDSPAIDWPCRT